MISNTIDTNVPSEFILFFSPFQDFLFKSFIPVIEFKSFRVVNSLWHILSSSTSCFSQFMVLLMASTVYPMSKVHLEDHQENSSHQVETKKSNQRVDAIDKVERKSANVNSIKAHMNHKTNYTLSIMVYLTMWKVLACSWWKFKLLIINDWVHWSISSMTKITVSKVHLMTNNTLYHLASNHE